jgi:CRP-like cAMP-binding protein
MNSYVPFVAPITSPREKCSQCWVHTRTEWSVLSEKGLAEIDAVRRLIRYRQSESIFHQHEQPRGIYCLKSGHLLLRHFDPFGEQINFQVVKYGETLGWRSFFADRPHAATAIALSQCDVCFIPGWAVNECIEAEPELARTFLRTVARDRGPSEALMLRSPRLSARIRFIYLLMYLRKRCAKYTAQRTLVYDLPLTRQDIASMIGVRSETLSRVIRVLQKEKLARFNRRQITVPDPERLFGLTGMKLSAEE